MCKRASKPRQMQRANLGHTQKLSMCKAQTLPSYTQPIQEVVGHELEVRGYGLAVGREENLFWVSYTDSFMGSVLLG